VIVVCGCNKGGAGKSTTCVNLAVGLMRKGKNVCVLDADGQASGHLWYGHREAGNHLPKVPLTQKYGNLVDAVTKLAAQYDHVLVDVAGRNSPELITSMVVADVVIAPHQCSDFDLDTLRQLRKQYAEIKPENPKLRVLVYQAIASTHSAGRVSERAKFLDKLAAFPEFEVLNSIGRSRKVYKDSTDLGLSVLELRNKDAIQEINELMTEVFHV
jgi:chromosome partitioning protein